VGESIWRSACEFSIPARAANLLLWNKFAKMGKMVCRIKFVQACSRNMRRKNMHTKKVICLCVLSLLALFTTSCGLGQEAEVAVAVALTQTAVVVEPPAAEAEEPPAAEATEPPAAETGFITGTAHLMAPGTPPMVIYAADFTSGEWFSVATPETDGATPYTLEVSPGTYLVFAFPIGLGYAADYTALTPVTVSAGQTITDITLGPPGPSDCGLMFGIPASPDGQYAEIVGATAECLASMPAPQSVDPGPPAPIESELMQVQFAPGDDSTQIFGDIPPNGIDHYILRAMAGQEMTVSLDVFDGNPTTFAIWGADGTILNPYDTTDTSWTGTLPYTQDYYIDILSRDDLATIDYALVVVILALEDSIGQGITGGMTGPIGYPESTTPPLHIVVTHLESGDWYWVGTAENAGVYNVFDLRPGSYHVAAYTQNGLIGGHADGNGSFIPVMVGGAELVEDIYLTWWERGSTVNDPVGW
jgi:hypothetical protein